MIINSGSRSGSSAYTAYLGAHLQRTDTNERVLIRKIDGVAAVDLTEALREMAAVGEGARSRLPLFHANIDWRHDETMTDAQKERTVERLAQEHGLTGQPHVVVEHVKEGREHLHVVWLRIDAETMKAIPDSHNFRKNEIVARELEREFEHQRVQGAHVERDGVDRPARCPTLGETRQAERSGMTPAEAKAQLRELWNMADNGQAFMAALNDAGWILAQGDKRGFVALDPTGEVRAVNKAITGLSAAKVRERLADIDADRLPSVSEAREQLAARRQQQQETTGLSQVAGETKDAPATAIEEARKRAGEGDRHSGRNLAARLPEDPQLPTGDQVEPAQPLLRRKGQVETQRPPIDLSIPKQGLLMRVVMGAWNALRSLGERLEAAFSAILGKEPEPVVETGNRLPLRKPEPAGRPDVPAGFIQDKRRAEAPRTTPAAQSSPPGYAPDREAAAPEAVRLDLQKGADEAAAEAQLERMRRQRAEMIEQLQLTHTKGRGGPSL